MKRQVLLISAAAAVFAAGYFTGQSRVTGGNAPGSGKDRDAAGLPAGNYLQDPLERRESRSKTGDRSRPPGVTITGKGPLFPAGQSRQWLEDFAKRSWDGEMVGAIGLVQQCSMLDPAAAREMAETALELGRLRDDGDPEVRAAFGDQETLGITALSSLFRLSQTDPQAALDLLEKTGKGNEMDFGEMRQMIYANMAKGDLPQIMAKLDAMQGNERIAALDGAVRALGAKDPQAAIDLLEKNPGPEYREQRQTLINRLAATNPELALRAATAFTVAGGNPGLMGKLIESGTPQLAERALAWAKDYQGEDRNRVNAKVLEAAAAKDPALAAAHLAELGGGLSDQEAGEISQSAVNVMIQRGDDEAARWVRDLPPGPVQESARLALAQRLMEKEPGNAGEIINAMQDGPRRDTAVELLVAQIAKDSPEDALKWVEAMPAGEKKHEQRAKVFAEWMLKDPDTAAAKWGSAGNGGQ